MSTRVPAAAVLVAALAAAAGATAPSRAASRLRDPLIAAAGDIACSPSDPAFHDGAGDDRHCAQRRTSDLLLDLDPDAVLMLGDAQYDDGRLEDFEASYGPTWGRVKAKTRPVIGNHEYFTGGVGYFDYFDGPGAFSGPAGDRDKGYYSYDLGAWHFVALDSVCSRIGGCQHGSAQEQWLRADLAAHPTACTLAYWHHPLFTSASGSWTSIRPLFEVLYDAGVDVVLNGHAHQYERFAPQDAAGDPDPAFGVREFVVGTGGKSLSRPPTAPARNAEVVDASMFGVLALTLHPGGYDWRFVPTTAGTPADAGSGGCHGPPPPRAPTAATGPATGSDRRRARLNAAVDPKDQAGTYRFDYGPTAAYGHATRARPVDDATAGRVEVAARIAGLQRGRTYHYRVVAANATGTTVGGDRTFVAGVGSDYERTIRRTPGLLAYWRLDHPGDGFAFDQRGLNLGLQDGAPAARQRGAPVGDRDAASAFAGTSSVQTQGPVLSTAGTIEGWFRWSDGSVLLRDDSATGGWFLAGESRGRVAYRVSGRTYRTERRIDTLRDGAWHHVALTKQGGATALFVDGRRAHSDDGAGSLAATMPWHIMRNGPLEGRVTGVADEVAMYDRALDAAVLGAHYRAGVRDRAPQTTVSGPVVTNDRQPELLFGATARRATFRCAFAPGRHHAPFATCGSPWRPPQPLADGTYSVAVYGVAARGYPDPQPARWSFVIDTVAPTLALAAEPVVARGAVTLALTCSERCDVRADIVVSAAAARVLKASGRRSPVLAGAAAATDAPVGTSAPPPTALGLSVDRPTLKALRAVHPLTATLRVSAADAAGNATALSRVVTLHP